MMTTSAVPFQTLNRLVPVDAKLPLREVTVEASARGGLSRVVLRQRFRNDHAEPLSVSYLFPLPEDAAVSGYAFTIGERRITGEVDRKKAARDRFEAAIAEGHTAALLDQERTSLFTQEIGNVPPGAEVTAEITLDQPLRWIDEGSWEWRFPLASAPRYLGAAGRVPDASRVAHTVADGQLPVRASLKMTVGDALADGAAARPMSPSHGLSVTHEGGALRLTLADEGGAALDRDLVVRWGVATATPGATLATFAPELVEGDNRGYGLLTVVPPRAACRRASVSRDLIVLLDTSGSMDGAPLEHARRVCLALIDTLAEADQLEMIEFSSRASRWKRGAVAATAANKAAARTWLEALRAGGSTEMRDAIDAAMAGLRPGGQRQVILVTDGQIGFESEVVASILQRLPVSSRVHTVGVGSSVNRSLTGGAARAGRGVEVIIGLDEDVERAARRLVARTDAPIVVDLTLSGPGLLQTAPERLPDLFAGAPLLIATCLAQGAGPLVLRGRTSEGEWTQQVHVDPFEVRGGAAGDPAIGAFFARQRVEDLEMEISAGRDGDARTRDQMIEDVAIRHQISTRLTSWVAVSDVAMVDPRDPTRRVRVPQNLPYGMSVEGMGLRRAAGGMPSMLGGTIAAKMDSMEVGRAAPEDAMDRTVVGDPSRQRRSAAPPARYGSAPRPAPAGKPSPALPSRPAPSPSSSGRASTPAPAPGAPTVFRRAMQAVGDFFTRGRSERKVRGRLVSRRGAPVLVELTADDGPIDFILGAATVVVHFLDGSTAVATIDLASSTREGTIAQGASARIALGFASASAAPIASVTLELPAGALVIVLT